MILNEKCYLPWLIACPRESFIQDMQRERERGPADSHSIVHRITVCSIRCVPMNQSIENVTQIIAFVLYRFNFSIMTGLV